MAAIVETGTSKCRAACLRVRKSCGFSFTCFTASSRIVLKRRSVLRSCLRVRQGASTRRLVFLVVTSLRVAWQSQHLGVSECTKRGPFLYQPQIPVRRYASYGVIQVFRLIRKSGHKMSSLLVPENGNRSFHLSCWQRCFGKLQRPTHGVLNNCSRSV